ncbi:MAG: NUDIX domain-containing protein [Clostridia bacterium]|nr:NUDIX domain-containing protein [Clostridia bacterium]
MADFTVHFYEEAPAELRQKYAVIVARHRGKLLWCRHRSRSTWELPGGHIEPGETAIEAAARELQEETGATDFTLTPLCWYRLHFSDGGMGSFSLLCTADVLTLGDLRAEIAEVRTFDDTPPGLTYPDIQPYLLAEALRRSMT